MNNAKVNMKMMKHEQQTSRREKSSNFFGGNNFSGLNLYLLSLSKYKSIFSIVLFVLFSGAFGYGAENLLKNGNFEQIGTGTNLPAEWAPFLGSVEPKGKIELSNDSFAGKYAVKLTKIIETPNTVMLSQRVNAKGARDYILKYWVRTSGKSSGFCYVSFYSDKKEIAIEEGKKQSPPIKEVANWTLVTWKFSSPAGTEHIDVTLRNACAGVGEAWMDNVELNEITVGKEGVERAADWKLVFADDFKSGKLEDNWKIVSGKWSAKDGVLHGEGHVNGVGVDASILCKKEFGSNLRLEYTVWTDDPLPCDLSAYLCVNPQTMTPLFNSYFFGFGNNNNSKHTILRDRKEICRTMMEGFSSSIATGRKYRVAVQRHDDRLSLSIDGKPELQVDDFASAEMSGRGAGFYFWNTGYISDVKIYALPDSDNGVHSPEVKAEVSEYLGFENEQIGLPPGSVKVDVSGAAKTEIVNEPTWIYREDGEVFVDDRCVHLDANGGAVSLLKSFKPVNAGIVEFDVLAKKPGSEIRVSLYDGEKHEAMSLVIDKDGTFFSEIGGEKRKLDDSITYRRRTVPTRFWFQPERWFTLRIWFDTDKGMIRSVGAVNLYTERGSQPLGWMPKKEFDQGDYHQLAVGLPLQQTVGGIGGFSIKATGDSDILFDNLCVLGPVGTLRANGQNLMRPMRMVMGLDFPPRKDPFSLKIYSLRNTATKEMFKNQEKADNWSGMSRWKVIQGGEKYASFTLSAAKTYNDLLVRQAFAAENADMLDRAAWYLVKRKDMPKEVVQPITDTVAAGRESEAFLGKAYQAYAHAYLNGLNEKELEEKFNPIARELDESLRKAEQQVDTVWGKLPKTSIGEGDRKTPCPLPVDTTPVVWDDGQWLKNGVPVFLYQSSAGDVGPTPPFQSAFRCSPNMLGVGTFNISVKPGEYIGDNMEWFKGLAQRNPDARFNMNIQTGVHYCTTYTPQWWLEENKNDPDILFCGEDGKPVPILPEYFTRKDRSPGVSLNFWNPKVKKLEYDMHGAIAGWLRDNAPGKTLFFNLLWEAHNCPPGGIETGHNASAIQAFQVFLQDTYKTINALNERWGTKYVSFDGIVPPKRGSPPSGVQYEFQHFRHQGYKEWILLCRKALQEKLPNTPVQNDFQEFLGGSGINSFDMPAYCEMSDIIAYHNYTAKPLKASDRWLDSLRKAYGNKAIGNNEWHAAMACPEMMDEESYKRNGLVQLFHRMMWGQSMSAIWGFNTPPHEGENDWTFGIPWPEPRLGYATVFSFKTGFVPLHLDRAARFGGQALAFPSVQPDIGILEVTSSYYNALPSDALRSGMTETAIALENKGYNYGIFYEKLLLEKKQALDGVQLLIVPNGTCLPPELCGILTEWVKGGGRLVATGALGVFNQYGRPDGTFLRSVFGEGNWAHNSYDNWKPVDVSIKPVETVGKAELYQHDLGKGTVWLFNTADMSGKILSRCLELVAENTARSFYCKDNKFDLAMRAAPDKTFLSMPRSPGKKYLYVLNSSLKETVEDEIIINGEFRRVSDAGLPREMLVPSRCEKGKTIVPLRLHPAEGTLLLLE